MSCSLFVERRNTCLQGFLPKFSPRRRKFIFSPVRDESLVLILRTIYATMLKPTLGIFNENKIKNIFENIFTATVL
uniref:Uncharacterized protein n=1 Tax=Anguilla anguilla TaxID=7936 RepID=A0A0E9X916_ANGAN